MASADSISICSNCECLRSTLHQVVKLNQELTDVGTRNAELTVSLCDANIELTRLRANAPAVPGGVDFTDLENRRLAQQCNELREELSEVNSSTEEMITLADATVAVTRAELLQCTERNSALEQRNRALCAEMEKQRQELFDVGARLAETATSEATLRERTLAENASMQSELSDLRELSKGYLADLEDECNEVYRRSQEISLYKAQVKELKREVERSKAEAARTAHNIGVVRQHMEDNTASWREELYAHQCAHDATQLELIACRDARDNYKAAMCAAREELSSIKRAQQETVIFAPF